MKTLLLFLFIVPISCFAQFIITGRVLSKADKKPIENVSVFLSNATVGDKTAADGSFTLRNVKPGKYDLVVTDVAYETYSQPLIVEVRDIRLPDIIIAPQTRSLQEVKIQYYADPDRSRYLDWFIEAFIGNSDRARDCKLINPEALDLKYDKEKQVLTASSADFLVIENDALGYRIKYLLNDFWLRDSLSRRQVRYRGYTLFEEMKKSAGRQARWQRAREDVYANSAMHFFRAAIADKLDENNFRVQKLADIPNPDRPPDSLISARIRYFKSPEHSNRDSLAFWKRKEKLPRIFRKLLPDALHKCDIIAPAGRNLYALYCDNCNLVVGYNTSHRFHIDDHIEYYYNRSNTDNTFVKFNSPEVRVYAMGVLSDPYSLSYDGVWGRSRVAELLPIDYEP
ncbi:MAG: carboxypeptidase-like regulatory domain-containing protein, partial [Mucilaginibacter sp.]